MSRAYVYPDPNNIDKLKLEIRSQRPEQAALAPIDELTGEYEDPEWLQIESVQVGPDIFENIATVNQLLKDQIISNRLAEKNQKEQEKEQEDQQLRDVKKNIKKIKLANLQNANDIKMAIIALKQAVVAIERRLINMEEN